MADPFAYSAILALAGLAAFIGALAGSRAAWPLLASATLVELAKLRGIPFDPLWWFALDCMVIGCIVRRAMPRRDWAILALFPVAWAAYLTEGEVYYWTTWAVVVVQLSLSARIEPLANFWRCARKFNRTFDPWDGLRRALA